MQYAHGSGVWLGRQGGWWAVAGGRWPVAGGEGHWRLAYAAESLGDFRYRMRLASRRSSPRVLANAATFQDRKSWRLPLRWGWEFFGLALCFFGLWERFGVAAFDDHVVAVDDDVVATVGEDFCDAIV